MILRSLLRGSSFDGFTLAFWGVLKMTSTTLSSSGAAKSVVGQDCAFNVIAKAIPCYRVVRKNGALAGYRWGVERKCALHEREAGA
jgi:O6-methylguanine-DNA--protein-cysteine methyltransferase